MISANSGNKTLSVLTNATVFPALLPIIISQPQSQTNFVEATVTFQVVASSPIPLSYQWRKNGIKLVDGDNLSGTRTNLLTLTGISYNDAALYSVIVSNTNGSVISSNAVLTVLPPRTATGIATLTGGFVTGVRSLTVAAATPTPRWFGSSVVAEAVPEPTRWSATAW